MRPISGPRSIRNHKTLDDKALREKAIRLAALHNADDLAMMISDPSLEEAAAAIIALGINGEIAHAALLIALLRQSDEQIAKYSEDAIWSIWMRAGSEEANEALVAAVGLIGDGDHVGAFNRLTDLVRDEPDFAEAHHQRGVAAALLDQYDVAAACFSTALSLNRQHFGAMAGLGHAAAAKEDWDGALRSYRAAVKINPNIEGLFEAIDLIETAQERAGNPKSASQSA